MSGFGGGGNSSFQFGQSASTFGNSAGGFGASNNNSGGFGAQSTTSPFGGNNNNASGGLFGAPATSSTGGFGGFGNNNNNNTTSLFGAAKPATGFGTTTNNTGGLFGNTANTQATGFGGTSTFGNNGASTTAFGGGTTTAGGFGGFGNNNSTATNTTNSVFGAGQQKPLFGAAANTTTGGFGSPSNGFGGTAATAVAPATGTAAIPFNPVVEKEPNGTTCRYETITFQEPYKAYSSEELRLADYNAGRQFGNGSSGTGAFGQTNFGGSSFTSNTGGFGANAGGSLFGNNNTATASPGFGNNTATGGAFGSSASGGLFGNNNQNKPGGLFGQSTTAAPSGGLFSTANNNATTPSTFGGFGANNSNAAGGLFGNTNNQTQNKPGGLFGTANTPAATTGGFSFGNSTNTQTNNAGGLFGGTNNTASNNTGGLFGTTNNNNQQQPAAAGNSLFGAQNQNTGGLFGAKPATGFNTATATTQGGGLFGNNTTTNTGGGLFGTNTAGQTNTGGGLFGANNNATNNTGGGLFGNQAQNKPGGLFGNNTTGAAGGLFGTSNTANNSGGLFGNTTNNNNNNAQPSGGLFGNANNNTGGGLFGAAQNNQNKGGLFGGGASTNNQGSSLFNNSMNSGGMFGQSQNNQQQYPQQQEVRHASLLDPNPYGQSSIWTSLPQPTPENSKPLFTPLTATKKMQESAMKPLPSLRLNQSRYNTPPRRNGFALSYSTHGTPNSATSTPGGVSLSGSMYGNRGLSGGSFGRSFNRSASVQNLRSYYASDSDDVWKPNAFAPSHRNSSGSIKRLTIDRSIRQDLFNRPQLPALPAPKPKNNTDNSSSNATTTDGNSEPPRRLNKRVSFESTVQETTLNGMNGALVRTEHDSDEERTPPPAANGATDSTRANELQAVPEDRESHQVSSKSAKASPKSDQAPGAYWMKPSRQEFAKMPREQKRAFKNFQVGRNGCGFINFDGTVDLESLNLDDVFGNIVNLEIRSATVYPDPSTKPLVGKGLNVPSTIELENSWPRNKGQLSSETSGRHYEQHIKRLRKMEGTDFINYDSARGIWKFKVPHYTTYGLDYDDDEGMDQSELSLPPTSLENSADASVMEVDEQTDSNDEDDTFAFKRSLPGQFTKHGAIEADELPSDDSQNQPEYDDGSDHSMMSEEDVTSDEEQSPHLPGALPQPTVELSSPVRPTAKLIAPGTPSKPLLDLEGDWAEQLQRTISPRKQNRDVLREAQSKVLLDKNFSPLKPKAAPQVNFRNSIDIMNSIFLPAGGKKSTKAAEPDFEFPYSKRSKTFHPSDEEMTNVDREWHQSFKPHFTNSGKMLYKTSQQGGTSWPETAIARDGHSTLVLGQHEDQKNYDLAAALATCEIKPLVNLVPIVKHKKVPFSRYLTQLSNADESITNIYNLAHILFDTYEDEFTQGLSRPLQKEFKDRIRKDRLKQFLVHHISEMISPDMKSLEKSDPLRAAVLKIVANDVKGACRLLKDQKSFRLMLIVAQLDSVDDAFMDAARQQIDAWRAQKSLSEIGLDVRALYEICAGNVTVCKGNEGKGVPVEDRAETFTIGQRYGLDWLQCFTLGLCYGRHEEMTNTGMATIEDAVLAFQHRCDRGEETQKPADNDAIWALLQYYSSQRIPDDDEAETVSQPSFPECIGSLAEPWNHSDLFDFYQAMAANEDLLQHLLTEEDITKLDQLAEVFSAELCAKGDVASAIFALLHISDADTRRVLIQDLLDRFASSLPGPDTATSNAGIELWTRLTMDLKVPQSWLYMSKARYAASATNNGGDNISELRYLVAAEAWESAHECLRKRVAPSYIIDQDWTGLLEMCGLFGDDPVRKLAGWYDGGAVHQTLASLMTGSIAKTDIETISGLRKKLVTLGSRSAKVRVQLGQLSNHEREEHIAIKEMANSLARLAMQGGSVGTLKEILELPVTQDVRADVVMCLGGQDIQETTTVSVSSKETGKTRAGRGRRGPGRSVAVLNDSEMVGTDERGEDATA